MSRPREHERHTMIVENEGAYHFYFDEHEYLGMLTYAGQLSDFRANIMTNKAPLKGVTPEAMSAALERCLDLLLDRYLAEQTRRDISDPSSFKSDFIEKEKFFFKELKHFERFASLST